MFAYHAYISITIVGGNSSLPPFQKNRYIIIRVVNYESLNFVLSNRLGVYAATMTNVLRPYVGQHFSYMTLSISQGEM